MDAMAIVNSWREPQLARTSKEHRSQWVRLIRNVANSSAKRSIKSKQKTALPTVFLICGFSVGFKANAKAGIWGVFLMMGSQKLISSSLISENFEEFDD